MSNHYREELVSLSLGALNRLFTSLKPPTDKARSGMYRGTFIGPSWMRAPAPAFVAVTGLPGWKGKKFLDKNTAANVIVVEGKLAQGPTMQWIKHTSRLDGKPGVALRYGSDAPKPWCWITDELRAVDANMILGMSVIELPALGPLGIPFLLEREN